MRIDDFEVRKTSKDKCSVTKYYGDAENLVIPETIGEFVPVEIGKGLVRKSLKVRSISLPKSIESIDPELFGSLRYLEQIEIDSRRFISCDGVLYDKQMKTLVFYPPKKAGDELMCPDTVTKVDENAFAAGCSIKVFHVSGRLTSFPVLPSQLPALEEFSESGASDGVLYSGKTLLFYPPACKRTIFSVPSGIEKIAIGMEPLFPSSLKRINVPESLKEGLVENAVNAEEVNVDNGNKVYQSLSGVVFSRSSKTLMMYPKRKKDDVYFIPAGTSSIGKRAFEGTSLKALILPQGISAIEEEAFKDASIEVITLPSSLSAIDIMAFQDIKDVRQVRVEMFSIADVFIQGSVLRPQIVYSEHI